MKSGQTCHTEAKSGCCEGEIDGIVFVDYKDESQLEAVMSLVGRDLSEPYSSTLSFGTRQLFLLSVILVTHPSCLFPVFTYRYFLNRFPHLCILACRKENVDEPIGCVVGKMDMELIVDSGGEREHQTGYIGMLAVQSSYRRLGIGRLLVKQILKRMKDSNCVSVTLETEVSNKAAQRLYQDTFGFLREELLVRYYLNWGDAYRLRLWF
jgi:peptide alpha-N-acetyltransferase